ncbi:MAG TPA: T9SS type A sorting domain-containing protein [Flavobacteriales bacterium]
MRQLLLASLLPLGLTAYAQTLTSLTVNPNPPTDCQRFLLTINGTLPQNAEFTQFLFDPSGPNEVNIRILAEGSTSGAQPAFSYPYENYGPLAQGTWTINVQIYINGNLADTESITFDVIEQGPIDMGEAGEHTVCNSDPPFDLFSAIGGNPTPGGIWHDPTWGLVPNGMFIPGTMPEGLYTYELPLAGECTTQYQIVTISYTPNPSAGYGGTVPACSAAMGPSVDLFAELNGDPASGGTWSGPSALDNGVYVPGVNTPGQYVYTVQGQAPCGNATATITIQAVNPSNAGTATDFSICESDQSENLNQHVTGEQTNGTWLNELGFTVAGYNQPLNFSTYGPGEFTFHYVIANAACGPDSSTLVVTVLELPCGVGVEEHGANDLQLLVKPNPADAQVVIEAEMPGSEGQVTFELIGVDGRLIHSTARAVQGGLARWTIDVQDMAPGAYTVRMRTSAGVGSKRLLVR